MKLLDPKQFNTERKKEADLEIREIRQRRAKIIEEINVFNHRKKVLEEATTAIEEEFNRFCEEINHSRGTLVAEIKLLAEQKKELVEFINKFKNIRL